MRLLHLLSRLVLLALTGLPATALLVGCGTGPARLVTVNTTALDFGSTSVGVAVATRSVALLVGSAGVTVNSVAVAGSGANSFTTTSNCTGPLAANASCSISVGFNPAQAGSLSATLTITDNSTTSPHVIALSGTGLPLTPTATLSAASINFGSQSVGAPAITQTITVTNQGNANLIFSSIRLSSGSGNALPYTLAGSCSTTLLVAVGERCTLVVSYAPVVAGTQNATLMLIDNAADSPQSVSISGTAYTGLGLAVSVLAGAQPVSGSTVQLYAAGLTGNGSLPVALLNSTLTDATGAVALPGQYNCPSSTTQLYLVSRGGAVSTTQTANSHIAMMTALGSCSAITPTQKVVINEATTVAAVVALAPFYASGGIVGASATNATGLANAFATASQLANPATGSSPGVTLPSNATSPTARLYSLANLINRCVVSEFACSAVLSAATPAGATTPADTLEAIYNIVRHPASNVSAIDAASRASTAYALALTAAPTDWTFFLTLKGGGMNAPSGIGIDSTGSVWVANYFNVASKFTALGAPVFASGITGSGLNNSYGLAMDGGDNVWIPNQQPVTNLGTGSVSEFNAVGASLAGATGYIAGGMNYPISVAVDPNGTTWIVDYGNSHLTLLNASGVPLSGPDGYTTALFAFPVAVSVDGNHFGWIANQSGTTVTKASADGTSFTNYNCCNGASGIAIDQANDVWVANYYGSSVSLISNPGVVLSKGTYTGAGALDHPQGIAVDGAGNIWVANFRAPYLTELAGVQSGSPGTSLSPATGYGADAALLEAYAIAVDASGNVWTTNFGSDTVTKFIGIATPVKTPLAGLPQTP